MKVKQRLLCVHDYRESGLILATHIHELRKKLKFTTKFVFIEANLDVFDVLPSDEPGMVRGWTRKRGKSWWFSRKDYFFRATDYSDYVDGFKQSISEMEDMLINYGPFDGVFGFGQGAAMVAMMSVMKQRGELRQGANFKYVILVSPFKSRCSPHNIYYSENITTVPSLHVIGSSDQVVKEEMSLELASLFTDRTILMHEGGHIIPTSVDMATAYIDFMARFPPGEKNELEEGLRRMTISSAVPKYQ